MQFHSFQFVFQTIAAISGVTIHVVYNYNTVLCLTGRNTILVLPPPAHFLCVPTHTRGTPFICVLCKVSGCFTFSFHMLIYIGSLIRTLNDITNSVCHGLCMSCSLLLGHGVDLIIGVYSLHLSYTGIMISEK